MKKLLFIGLLLMTMTMNSQTVDGKPLSEIDSEYIQIWFSNNYESVTVHYGQEMKLLYNKKSNIADESGKPLEVRSHMPVINMFAQNGYEIISVNRGVAGGTQTAWTYTLRKKE